METPALVSIIMPFYNPGKFLGEAVQSVFAQTHQRWELLLIDDGSTDRSLERAKKWADKDNRVRVLSLSRNSGAGVARNLGTQEANGRYIAFLDADDRWLPRKLEIQLRFMLLENCSISYSSYLLIDACGEPLQKKVEALPSLRYEKLLKSNYVGNLTGMYDVSILGKLPISPLRKRQDWALWLDAVKKAGKAHGIAESLAEYRLTKNSLSSNKTGMLQYNFAVYRQHLGFSYFKSLRMMGIFLYEHFYIKPAQVKDL